VELVEESLRRIEAAADLNAVTAVYADDALSEARGHDRTGPLAGLPVLVKDMARVAGKVTTMGSRLFADAPPDTVDDVVVGRLRAAGAIVIGRTNSPEFGATATTVNPLFGATLNPWNTARTPGGSSGGSAAALAAGLAPLATTSDGGGSVRAPASLCGLVGYKPTMGAIGRNMLPRWIGFSTQGATGAGIADVILEASVTHGPARGDFLSLPAGSIPLEPVRPRKILVCRSFRADVDPDVEAAFEATLDALARDGATIERVDSPFSAASALTWLTISTAELAESLGALVDRVEEMSDYVRQQVRFGARVTAAQYVAAQRERHRLGGLLDDLLGDDAVLVTPTINTRSWAAEGPMPDAAGSVTDDPSICLNTPEINMTGHPAVSVPTGLDDHGVPCGMQIIAPRFADSLALGLAGRVETIRPWPVTAPGYEPFGPS
jgi:amidase/aspartyl-tRNA(Asn)/glutamyl-tRNA(Gln) amidotransferase subunit A